MPALEACSEAFVRLRPDVRLGWTARPLSAFEDQPLEELATAADLVVIDHPHCGSACEAGALQPIDALLDASTLAELAAASAGASHRSYQHDGRQWALALDGACQVAAVRDDLMDGRPDPRSWGDVLSLARERRGSVAVPLLPAHAMCTFLALCAADGAPVAEPHHAVIDPHAGAKALAIMHELYRLGPAEARAWDPPTLLEHLATSADVAYVPLAFGYVTYALQAAGRVRFTTPPAGRGGTVGSVLGGTGLAVTSGARHPVEAAEFAAFACAPATQRTVIARTGGQPAALAAWRDSAVDAAANSFYSGTLDALEAAWVRPRDAWWPRFQNLGGQVLATALAAGEPPELTLKRLERLGPR